MAKDDNALQSLESLKAKAEELRKEQADAIKQIREGLVDSAILFMDVVGSTQFKTTYRESPETWILRVRQFSLVLADAVERFHGRVVKFIGDEVMGVFENILDAQNLISRIDELQDNLSIATGHPTQLKIAADFGPVYFLKFDGHDEPDPQGTPVDRCARIGKYTPPGHVLASQAFAEKTGKLHWLRLGTVDLKGLGQQTIYQLGATTADISEKVTLLASEHEAIKEELGSLRVRVPRLEQQNLQLQEQLATGGVTPAPEASVQPGAEVPFRRVEARIVDLVKLLGQAPGGAHDYARYVYRYYAGKQPPATDAAGPASLDQLRLAGIVSQSHGIGFFALEPNHKLNVRALKAVEAVEEELTSYLAEEQPSDDDPFDWTMRAPEFWSKYVGINVF